METLSFYATGKRKTAIARVWLRQGNGIIKVNRKKFEDYFPTESLRSMALSPFKSFPEKDNYNLLITVRGGGVSGQAAAVRHGLARALVNFDAALRGPLKKEGMLTRDPREVERKKYGRPKARKRFQFSKR